MLRIFKSEGIKRLIASGFAAVYSLLASFPETASLLPILLQIAAFFGITGVAHATVAGTVPKFKLATVSAVLSIVIGVAYFFPQFEAVIPLLQKIAGLLGAGALGATLAARKTINIVTPSAIAMVSDTNKLTEE